MNKPIPLALVVPAVAALLGWSVRVAPAVAAEGAATAPASSPANWSRWRGSDGSGRSTEAGVPTEWDAKAVAWRTPLKGRGQSSPVIWGDHVYLTTALEDGRQRVVLCLDRRDGKLIWEQIAWTGDPEPADPRNGWATPTCCTDGDRVYASFGKAGVHCYTADGKHVWSRELGEFLSRNKRGVAASPVLAGNLLIVNGDSESDPFLFGLDKLTGKTVWKSDRPADEGYSTPVFMRVGDHEEMILNGGPYVAGYDPATGHELWRCKSFAGRGEPTPAIGKGVVYVVNGLAGDVYAVKPGGKGDVTKTQMAWHTARKQGRDEPSPIEVDGFVFVANMAGVVTCYAAEGGKELWKQRTDVGQMWAGPIAAGKHVYFIGETGKVVVVEAGPLAKIVANNSVGPGEGELFRASMAVSGTRLLIRSDQALYCVGTAK